MAIGFIGDVHGDVDNLVLTIEKLAEDGVNDFIQVGDYWCYEDNHVKTIDQTLENISEHAKLRFIDGNHENREVLGFSKNSHMSKAKSLRFGSRTIYQPRGTTECIDGRRVGFFGGAATVILRKNAKFPWSKTEIANDNELKRGVNMRKLDILVTHDAPNPIVDNLLQKIDEKDAYAFMNPYCVYSRNIIDKVLESTQPNYLVHGHYHHRNDTSLKLDNHTTNVTGLGIVNSSYNQSFEEYATII